MERILATMGVPFGTRQRFDGKRYILGPVADAYDLLRYNPEDRSLIKIVMDYLETFLLMRGGVYDGADRRPRLAVSFFGQKLPLPQDFDSTKGLNSLSESEPTNEGLTSHLRLLEYAFSGIL